MKKLDEDTFDFTDDLIYVNPIKYRKVDKLSFTEDECLKNGIDYIYYSCEFHAIGKFEEKFKNDIQNIWKFVVFKTKYFINQYFDNPDIVAIYQLKVQFAYDDYGQKCGIIIFVGVKVK